MGSEIQLKDIYDADKSKSDIKQVWILLKLIQ